ncbi:MAG: type II toxin-antitoxin system death-on-curing family toxin [Candidatus Thorarchaeota archaeon]|nr:type II toxin-antitoxin system death-on-curing family toxin [Candidatus Thorarchaeota archaeon]
MRYLTFDEIVVIHGRLIDAFGGEGVILSEEALENCVALPMMAVFGRETSSSLWLKAATLLHAIVTRHPFVDGNKRTAWTAAKVFLLVNGFRLSAQAEDAERVVLRTVKGEIGVKELARWIELHSKEV